MKQVFVLSIAVLFFTSCSNSNNNIVDNSTFKISDTTNFKTIAPPEPDSATIAQAKIAYGDVMFGISGKEFNKLMPDNYNIQIGDYKYDFYDYYVVNDDYYKRDSLYRLDIKGNFYTANFYDTKVLDELKNLANVITRKYGAADIIYDYPSFLSMKPGYTNFTHKWKIHTKSITLGISEESDGSKYQAICSIVDDALEGIVNERIAMKSNENLSKDADNF